MEHGTIKWSKLRDAEKMPDGWSGMWFGEKGNAKKLLKRMRGTIVTIGQKTYSYFQTNVYDGSEYSSTMLEFSFSPDFAMCPFCFTFHTFTDEPLM